VGKKGGGGIINARQLLQQRNTERKRSMKRTRLGFIKTGRQTRGKMLLLSALWGAEAQQRDCGRISHPVGR